MRIIKRAGDAWIKSGCFSKTIAYFLFGLMARVYSNLSGVLHNKFVFCNSLDFSISYDVYICYKFTTFNNFRYLLLLLLCAEEVSVLTKYYINSYNYLGVYVNVGNSKVILFNIIMISLFFLFSNTNAECKIFEF